jgi:hypothetical protein
LTLCARAQFFARYPPSPRQRLFCARIDGTFAARRDRSVTPLEGSVRGPHPRRGQDLRGGTRRYYTIARGSATESAAPLDVYLRLLERTLLDRPRCPAPPASLVPAPPRPRRRSSATSRLRWLRQLTLSVPTVRSFGSVRESTPFESASRGRLVPAPDTSPGHSRSRETVLEKSHGMRDE